MIVSLKNNNLKGRMCTLDDYDEIIKIHQSQPKIHGVPKTDYYNNYFCSGVKTILKQENSDYYVLGTVDENNKVVGYVICYVPKQHGLGFLLIAEGKRVENDTNSFNSFTFTVQAMTYGLEYFANIKVFEIYTILPTSELIGWARLFNRYVRDESIKFTVGIHSVIDPSEEPRTEIEKVFIRPDSPIPRTLPLCVMHASLKSKFRWKYFKESFQRYDNESKFLQKFCEDQESQS